MPIFLTAEGYIAMTCVMGGICIASPNIMDFHHDMRDAAGTEPRHERADLDFLLLVLSAAALPMILVFIAGIVALLAPAEGSGTAQDPPLDQRTAALAFVVAGLAATLLGGMSLVRVYRAPDTVIPQRVKPLSVGLAGLVFCYPMGTLLIVVTGKAARAEADYLGGALLVLTGAVLVALSRGTLRQGFREALVTSVTDENEALRSFTPTLIFAAAAPALLILLGIAFFLT